MIAVAMLRTPEEAEQRYLGATCYLLYDAALGLVRQRHAIDSIGAGRGQAAVLRIVGV